MGVHGPLFLLLTSSTYVYSILIPNMSLIMSTQEELFVFTGLQDWVTNRVISQNKLSAIRLNDTRGISFIYREIRQFLIFSSANLKAISLVNLTDSNSTTATIFHIGTSCGVGEIAVDWVSGNCYWVDEGYGWIVMQAIPKNLSIHNSRNPNFKKVVDTYLDVPTGIAVYPEKGYLFWTDTGKIPKIERSSLNGEGRKLLTWQGVIWPTSLCIDYSQERLYWTDPKRGTVEYSDLHGNGRAILVSSPGSSFYGIDIFQDNLVVSDLNGSIKLFSKDTGRQVGPPFEIKKAVYTLTVLDDARQPLDNSQRCDMIGCQQLCIERPNSTGADCACEDGYDLQLDGLQCKAETQVLQRKIAYTDTNKICSVSINAITSHQRVDPKIDCTVVNSSNNITRFTIDTHTKTFYFTDGQNIYYQTAFSINGSQEIYSTNRKIMDLAYDYINTALYWFEWDTNGGVCFKKTGPTSIEQEITRTTTKPVTMTFDPYNQRLFWMTEEYSKLYTRGSDGKTNITGSAIITKPTDLEYDWSTDSLFWTGDGYMGRMYSNGTNDKKIFLNSTRNYHSLTVFKNFAIIGYSVPNHPDEAAFIVIQEGESCTQINFQLRNMRMVDEVKVYADSQQLLEIEPCEKNNGGCEQICLPGLNTSCGCHVGYTLKEDGKTCLKVFTDKDFIIAIDSIDYKAYQISTVDKSINAVEKIKGKPSSLDFDPIRHRIVWIDRTEHSIKHFKVKITDVIGENKDDITQNSHVAVDVSTGNFYVTLTNKIAVIDPEFDVKTLIAPLQNPGKLIVFPKRGQMAWVEGSKIRMAKMDGSNPHDFVTNEIQTLSDIAFDYEGDALYWCDRTLNKVVRTELDSGTAAQIYVEEPNNIYVAGKYLYYTNYINRRAVFRRNKMPNVESEFTVIFDSPLVGGMASLFVYQDPQPAINAKCSGSNGGCCKFCLPLKDAMKCECTDSTEPTANRQTCSQDVKCPPTLSNANLENTCLPCNNRHCSFTCNDGFELTVSGTTLKCISGNWNYSNEFCKDHRVVAPYIIIVSAAGGGGGGLLLVVIVIIIVVLYRHKRPKRPRINGSGINRPPMPVPRPASLPPVDESTEIYHDINSISLIDGANGHTPPYLELSESHREYEKLPEKNPYKLRIVNDKRPSETVHDDYLTPSIAGSFREGLNDLRVSHPEEDDHGYLRSSNEYSHRYRSSGSSDVSTRYQPWDMMQHQARGNFSLQTTNPVRYPDDRTSRFERQQRY